MPQEMSSTQLNSISKAIESSYQELKTLIDKIGEINHVIETFKNSSHEIREQYAEALDHTKLKAVQSDYQQTVKDMEKSLSNIQDKIIEIQTIKKVAEDSLGIVIGRMKNFEKLLDSLNNKSKNLDKKLTQSMETIKLKHANIEKKADKAFRLVELNYQVDKYDEILQLQKENNKLLKNLTKKDNSNHK